MNSISLIGNLGKDPEIKYLESGKIVCKFSIAVKRPFKRDESDWFNCEAWGKTAETIAQYLKKGSQAGFTGSMVNDRYEDKEGNKRDFWKMQVDRMDLLGSKSSGGQAEGEDGSIPF